MNLYRFEKVNSERIKTIEDTSIHCTSPRAFNDLSDCRLFFDKHKYLEFVEPNLLKELDFKNQKIVLGDSVVSELIKIVKKSNDDELKRELKINHTTLRLDYEKPIFINYFHS